MIEASIAFPNNTRSRPLIEGRVKVEGVELTSTVLHGSEMFWRQLHYGDFDISEMSMSSLLISASRGDFTWVAIPVFSMRRFFHTYIMGSARRRNQQAEGFDRPQSGRAGIPTNRRRLE